MKYFILILGFSLFSVISCGTSEKKQADTEQAQVDSAQHAQVVTDTTAPEISSIPSDRLENTIAVSDSMITKEYSSTADISNLTKKTGKLNYSGNAPFTFPTLYESDSSSYRLIGDDEFLNTTFKELNGTTVTLYGKVQSVGGQNILEVHYYRKGKH